MKREEVNLYVCRIDKTDLFIEKLILLFCLILWIAVWYNKNYEFVADSSVRSTRI